MRNLLHISIIFPIFVMLSYIIGARMPDIEGIFFALEHKDTALPCRSRNSFGSPDEGLSKGRGGIPFLLPPQNLNPMLKNSSGDDVALASEIWKDIEGYEGLYQVSNLGRVRSLNRRVVHHKHGTIYLNGKVLRPSYGGNGYPSVNLWISRQYKTFLIHRLVAEAFIPKVKGKPCINHINGDRTDFSINNLEWCTHKENLIHASHHGLLRLHMIGKCGHLHHNSKAVVQLTSTDKIVKEYGSISEAESLTGIAHSTISKVCKGKARHAGGFIWKYKEAGHETA